MFQRRDEGYDWTKNRTAQDALNDLLRAFDEYREGKKRGIFRRLIP